MIKQMVRLMPNCRMHSWAIPEIPHLECFRAVGFVHEYPRHSHRTWAIGVVDDGIGGIWHRGTNERVGPGMLIAVAPGVVHTGYPLQRCGMSHSTLYLDHALVKNILPEVVGSLVFPQIGIEDLHLARRLRNLCRTLELGGPLLAVETKLLSDLRCLFVRHARINVRQQAGAEPRHITVIQEYLRASLRRNVSLGDLAGLTGLSKAYIIRSFRRFVGMPPYEWFLQRRIEAAKERLQKGERICDLAMDLGFADQSHFHRRFRRFTGMTPATYAEGHYRSRRTNAQPG
jgi:AraC-like DNA-binding protein